MKEKDSGCTEKVRPLVQNFCSVWISESDSESESESESLNAEPLQNLYSAFWTSWTVWFVWVPLGVVSCVALFSWDWIVLLDSVLALHSPHPQIIESTKLARAIFDIEFRQFIHRYENSDLVCLIGSIFPFWVLSPAQFILEIINRVIPFCDSFKI